MRSTWSPRCCFFACSSNRRDPEGFSSKWNSRGRLRWDPGSSLAMLLLNATDSRLPCNQGISKSGGTLPYFCTRCPAPISAFRADSAQLIILTSTLYPTGRRVQCVAGGPGVPSDHLSARIMKIVTRSSGSSAAITGEPGRLAPQLSAVLPGKNHMWMPAPGTVV